MQDICHETIAAEFDIFEYEVANLDKELYSAYQNNLDMDPICIRFAEEQGWTEEQVNELTEAMGY